MARITLRFLVISCFIFHAVAFSAAAEDETLLLREPTLSAKHVAFVYAGDIWIVDRAGGEARRLTVHQGTESDPVFSPDGALIAFTGNYDGNVDVYVMPAAGGSPRRLTYHPGSDTALGWTPDGKRVLFNSGRFSHSRRYAQLFTLDLEGGFPEALPMPMADRGSYSPDGKRIAYTPISPAFRTWKRYRGGRISPIWLFDLKTYDYVEIAHKNANTAYPIWLGNTVYFLSDRNHTMNLFAYDVRRKRVRQVTHHKDYDVKSASGGPRGVVYEQAGRIHVYTPETDESTPLTIRVAPDLPHKRPHYETVSSSIRNADVSPTGVRAVFEARGDIFTVPAKKGDTRNLTRTPGVHERYPAWSPDGKWIAYLSDASGEYQLMLRKQKGFEEPTAISLGGPTYYYSPKWSPDSRKILYEDKRLNLFYMDLKTSKPVRVDTDTYDYLWRSLDPVWSPDGKWIAYTKRLDNQLRAVFLYDLAGGRSHQVTDGLSDAESPCFSRDGKYLFFAASTNLGLNVGWADMSSYERPIRKSLYVVVLNKEAPSPFAPESDEESVQGEDDEEKKGKDEGQKKDKEKNEDESEGNEKTKDADKAEEENEKGKDEAKKKSAKVEIDFENLDQRIIALPVPSRNYGNLQPAANGKLFYIGMADRMFLEGSADPSGYSLYRFDMKERKEAKYMDKVPSYWVSGDGKKLLYRTASRQYGIVKTDAVPKAGEGSLNLGGMEAYVDPPAEWEQMYDEAWRIQRDFFYAPNMHGADWPAIRRKYRSFLAHVGHRSDLNFVFGEMFGELVCGHAYVGGGDMPRTDRVSGGLLGCDYEIANGFYRIKKIYRGENWNPGLRAPLTEPGVQVSEGDYILSVNGRPLRAPTNIYSLFEKTSGRQTVLQVNDKPVLDGARTVTVVPTSSESSLRFREWIEGNRRKVDELTDGRVAYVYMPNTAGSGYTYFNRYYFAQLDREAVIIDERFNGGGSIADYILDMLDRPLLSYWATRDGKPIRSPNASIFGPKVMIINQYAGSGGDAMPHFFRRRKLGQLVGMRTWGGLVGIYGYPPLLDGGRVTAPRWAIYSPDGEWEVENEGVAPDVEVEMTPKEVIAGHDPQLEKAVEVILKELKRNPVKKVPVPPYPNRVK